MFKIEKSIPIPKSRSEFPFEEMAVGDSVIIPAGNVVSARSSASYVRKKTGACFTSRKTADGVRIWRTA